MSWSEQFVRDHKRRTDCGIHLACVRLAPDPPTYHAFQTILRCARERAPRLFEAPICDGRHLGVDALINLARFHDSHLRAAIDWPGSTGSWRPALSSLVQHFVSAYKVPEFLASCWYASDATGEMKRHWYVSHANGASFRSLSLPMVMTRKMEHIFLASHDHLSIELAMRRAELLSLGMSAEFVKAVMATRVATDLRDSEFWRTVWMFLIGHEDEVEAIQVGPLIDYIEAIRRDRTQAGMIEFGVHRPEFSMKGRTAQSMMRMMRAWHRSLGVGGAWLSWDRSLLSPLRFEEPARDEAEAPRRWLMTELINSAQLRAEGSALHHCVASYAERCHRGVSSIWSLRFWQAEKVHHVLTVEVDPKRRAVVQARGRTNRAATGKSLRLLEDWAGRERLKMVL